MRSDRPATGFVPDPSHETMLAAIGRMREQVHKRIVGQDQTLDEVLMALGAGGHALLVGVPGLAKTSMIRSVADAMELQFRRIQFTPDLVPSDVTGTEVMEEDATTRTRAFRFVNGPIFANVVLADEINRAPPRTQAALLEAMQERQVTAGGNTMPLPTPFFVLATQNPIEQEGTYPLPEAQLDRFLFDIRVGYPNEPEEVQMLRSTTGLETTSVSAVLDAGQVIAWQRWVREIPASEPALQYAARVVRASRPDEPSCPQPVKPYIRWGAGPRAGQALILGAKAHALLSGRFAVAPQDIRRVAAPVLRHRILLNFTAEAEGIDVEWIIGELLKAVPAPRSKIYA